VTIAVGHEWIVTFTPVTTEPTEGTPRSDPSSRAALREQLLVQHRAVRARREAAALGSDEYRAAAEEIARIEVQINRLEEPDSSV
jgi:transcription elongation GreA/GreB family factor